MTRLKTLAVCAFALSAASAPAVAGDVTVTIDGVQARGGQLLVGLQSRDQFLKPAGDHGQIIENPRTGTHTVVLRNVPAGDYSLSVLHDADDDGQMNMAGGLPAEGWTMLNAETLRAAPTFEQVKFSAPQSGAVSLRASMIYPAH